MNSTNLVPELQHYFSKVLMSRYMNFYNIPKPVSVINSDIFNTNSFIRLLFDDCWPVNFDNYNYMYRQVTDKNVWPRPILTRLMIYPISSTYYLCDSTDVNICNLNLFNLQSDDINLLNRLLTYRTTILPPSVNQTTWTDNNGVVWIFNNGIWVDQDGNEWGDQTNHIDWSTNTPQAYIGDIDFNILSTNLSKMIYLYLAVKLNNDISFYDDTQTLSNPNSVLESSYEIYLTESMFNVVQNRNIDLSQLQSEIIA